MKLLVIHLSDLHFKSISEMNQLEEESLEIRSQKVFDAIKADITNIDNTTLLVAVTGDMVNSGRESEFESMQYFLNILDDRIKDEYSNLKLIYALVPGNHDVYFDNPDEKLAYGSQSNYLKFVNSLISESGNTNITSGRKSIEINQVNLSGEQNIRLILINSSIKSTIAEKKGHIPLDVSMIRGLHGEEVFKEYGECLCTFTLLHHPTSWLDDDDNEKKILTTFIREQSDVVLVGHEHNADAYRKTNFDMTTNNFLHGAKFGEANYSESSFFNLLEIDFDTRQEKLKVFGWNSMFNRYDTIEDRGYSTYINNRYMNKPIDKCCDTFKEWLDDFGSYIETASGMDIRLQDVYIFPEITKVEIKSNKSSNTYEVLSSADFFEKFEEERKIHLSSSSGTGRTSLLKYTYKEMINKNIYPVYLDLKELKSGDMSNIDNLLKQRYREEYGHFTEIMQKKKKDKAILVDINEFTDYHTIRAIDNFCRYIESQFGYIIIAMKENMGTLGIKMPSFSMYINENYTQYKICRTGKRMTEMLLKNWFSINSPMNNYLSSDEWNVDYDVFRKKVEYVFAHQLLTRKPFNVLQVASLLMKNISKHKFTGKYAFLYEELVRVQTNKIETGRRAKYIILLEFLAFEVFSMDKGNRFDSSVIMNALDNHYKWSGKNKEDVVRFTTILLNSNIIKEVSEGTYTFSVMYVYYYFLANFITTKTEEDGLKDKIINNLCNNINKEQESSILMFLIYKSDIRALVVERLISKSNTIFTESEIYDIRKESIHIQKNNEFIELAIPTEEEAEKIRDLSKIEEDKRKREMEEIDVASISVDTLDDEVINSPLVNEVNTAMMISDIFGELIKNYSDDINGETNNAIISKILEINFKLIDRFKNESEDIIREIISSPISDLYMKAGDKEKRGGLKNYIVNYVKESISSMWYQLVVGININIGKNLDTPDVKELLERITDENEELTYDVAFIAFLYETTSRIPYGRIRDVIKKTNTKAFAMNVLQGITQYNMIEHNFYSNSERQKIASLLEFDQKKLLLAKAKNQED